MIANLTKEQVANLSPEQQEVIARLAIDEGRRRRSIIALARGYRGGQVIPWFVLFGMHLFWQTMEDNGIILPVLAVIGFVLIQFHAYGINSRLDAVIELLDQEKPRVLKNSAEQAGTGQPATRSESDSEDSQKPELEAEGRSQ